MVKVKMLVGTRWGGSPVPAGAEVEVADGNRETAEAIVKRWVNKKIAVLVGLVEDNPVGDPEEESLEEKDPVGDPEEESLEEKGKSSRGKRK